MTTPLLPTLLGDPLAGLARPPGSPATVRSSAHDQTDQAEAYDTAATGGTSATTAVLSGWTGDAADGFSRHSEQLVAAMRVASAAHRVAAQALSTYATALEAAQRSYDDAAATAGRAVAEEKATAQEQTQPAGIPVPPATPVSPLRAQARAQAEAAIHAAATAGDVAAGTLRAVDAAVTPPPPAKPREHHWWQGPLSAAEHVATDIGHGLADAGRFSLDVLEQIGQHPGQFAADAAVTGLGLLTMAAGAGIEGGGIALDATGVGAVVGVPANIAGAAVMTAGAGLTAAGGASLVHDTAQAVEDAQAQEAAEAAPETAGGPGEYRPVNESMSDSARAYQERVTGRSSDDAYHVDDPATGRPVKFDGYESDGDRLVDAKGPGYEQLLQPKKPGSSPFPRKAVVDDLVAQARRQTSAAGGRPIEWRVSEQQAADEMRQILRSRGIRGITVVHVP